VPVLLAAGVASVAALFLLPTAEHALAPNLVAAGAGALAWPALVWMLDDEPAARESWAEADIGGEAIEFFVENTPAGSARAYREFWMRSTREMRLGTHVAAPAGILFFGLAAVKLAPGSPLAAILLLIAALTTLNPVFKLFTGSLAAGARARQFPRLRVRVGPGGIALGDHERGLAWGNFVRVWQSARFMTLVMSSNMAVQLPLAQVPREARDLIVTGVLHSQRQDR